MKNFIIPLIIIILLLLVVTLIIRTGVLERFTTTIPPADFKMDETTPPEDIPRVSVIADNLSVPWALEFLPDNRILVTERSGAVKIVDQGNTTTLATLDVHQEAESGLHGITLDPDFDDNQYIYLYYTTSANGQNTINMVSRFIFEEDSLSNETVIVDNIPGARIHDGGRIKFGPDNYLYITTGDAAEPSLSQDRNSLAGKILRVDRDGNAPEDNPFGNEVYSYGHRNPQGITWDNEGRLWSTEHGPIGQDEFNLIERGENYGWPVITGAQTGEGMVSPILQSGDDTWAPAGLAYLNGKFYFGGLRGNALYGVEEVDGEYQLIEYFSGEFGRIREVVVGPDNMLYVTTSNRDGRGIPVRSDDRIIRINPQKM